MSNAADTPSLLSLILFTPLVGALVILLVGKRQVDLIRWIANATAVVGFLVSVPLWFLYDSADPDWQFVEQMEWIPSIGAQYFLGSTASACSSSCSRR